MKQAGMLNSEQFALAMYLIQQCKAGMAPPQQLTPEMIPPTSRPKPLADQGLAGLVSVFFVCLFIFFCLSVG